MGTLYSLVMIATYAHGYVVVIIGTIILLNLIILKLKYLGKTETKEIIDNFYNHQKENGTKEMYVIFLNALFTSWVTPCTVWTNKSKFLMVSSSITLSVHLINFISLYLIANSDMMNQIENPPILHCFNSYENNSNIPYNYYNFGNGTKRMINICKNNDTCLPLIRICSENEIPTTLMHNYVIPVGILLLVTSFSASLCLQILSNYTKMYAFLKTFCLGCPKTFNWFLTDFIFNYNELEETLRKQVLNNIEIEVTKNVAYKASIQQVLTLHCEYLETTEETKSLKIKLEKITKQNKSEKIIPQVVWKLPPMHAAVDKEKFGHWCFMYLMGGEAGALNGQPKSSINSIIEKSKQLNPPSSLLDSCNTVTQYLINKATETYGENALHKATKLWDLQLMKILLANGYNIDKSSYQYNTPLQLALEAENIDCLRFLLKNAARVTDEHLSFCFAASFKSDECLKILFQHQQMAKDINYENPLHISARKGYLKFIKYLIDDEADVNEKDRKGQTPLHVSAREGHLECVKFFIDNNADVNAKDKEGQTPLHVSASKGHLGCIKYLIDNKADVNAKDNKGFTLLHIFASTGDLEWCKYLIDNKADVNLKVTNGQTPLHISAWKNDLECMKFLIFNKANVNETDKAGHTPLHISSWKNHLECMIYLIDQKADVNAKDKNEQTPLHISSSYGQPECTRYLIDNKANVNAVDHDKFTPIHIVGYLTEVSKHSMILECAEILIRAGADLNITSADGKTPMTNANVKQLKKNKPELFI